MSGSFCRFPCELIVFFVLQIHHLDDWYSIEPEEVLSRGGRLLVGKKFKGDLPAALAYAFPKHPWEFWRFTHVPSAHWSPHANRLKFMQMMIAKVAKNKGVPPNLDLLYELSAAEVAKAGGAGLLRRYSNAWADACMGLYPNHPWKLLKFADFNLPANAGYSAPKRGAVPVQPNATKAIVDSVDALLDSIEVTSTNSAAVEVLNLVSVEDSRATTSSAMLKQIVDNAGKALHLSGLEGWYGISLSEVTKRPGGAMERFRHVLPASGSLLALLQRAYPEHVRCSGVSFRQLSNSP